ncbi:MAG TPA: CAP domain-containing protein [Acidimicrobiales bacterium]|nr:CAP domain-containing protein [Acidimicrobiales bacterium]
MTPTTRARARAGTRRPARAAVAAAALALASLAATGPLAQPVGAATSTSARTAQEDQLASKISGSRWYAGRAPLPFHDVLGDGATGWSGHMAWLGDLQHHPDLGSEAAKVDATWGGVAEIVGRGPDIATVHDAFMRSPAHREKIMGDWDWVGVGIVESGGQLWVTVRFLR